jgi:hypothetical protein
MMSFTHGALNSSVRVAAILAWRAAALCMIAENIADSEFDFACFGRLSANCVNGG